MNNNQIVPVTIWAACFCVLMNFKFFSKNKITYGVSGSPKKITRRDLYS